MRPVLYLISFAFLSFASTTALPLPLHLLLLTLPFLLRHVFHLLIFYFLLCFIISLLSVAIAFFLLWIVTFCLLCFLLALKICLFNLSGWYYLAFLLSILSYHNIFPLHFMVLFLAAFLASWFICSYLAFSFAS